ncbi:MAG: flagellar basal-body MS-ring/collar protein FliF [Gammaproteobacteria bacterium]
MAENEVADPNQNFAQPMLVPPPRPDTAGQILRQAGLLIGIAASVALGVAVVMWSQSPNYSLLFGNLSDRDANAAIEALQGSGIEYKVDSASGGILIPTSKLHEARMKLAAQGLPKSSSMGFEMLQDEQGFGTSQFIEKARYQRALEAELSRSISNITNVRGARVHLAIPKDSVFTRDKKASSASVVLDLYAGRRLEDGQIAAIAHMVSASVPSLNTSDVTVVDQSGRLLTRAGASEMAVSAERFDYARRVEETYVKRIENILQPIVGLDDVRAQVTADLDFTMTEQTSETFNPDLPAIRSEQTSEEQRTGGGGLAAGVPGALTNQPPGTGEVPEVANAEGDGAEKSASEQQQLRKKETRNYELDKTISHTQKAVGTLEKLSVAVVLNNPSSVDDAGKVTQTPYSAEEIEGFTKLIKDAVGFNVTRGDTVSVIARDFFVALPSEPLPEQAIWEQPWVWDVGKQALGGLFVLYLLFGVLRPTIKSMMSKSEAAAAAALEYDKNYVMLGPDGQPLVDADGKPLRQVQDNTVGDTTVSVPIAELGKGSSYETSLASVREYVKDEPKMAAQVVKNWVGQ